MKSSRRTAAALVVLLSAAACASAQAASVRIYGLVNTGLYYTNAQGGDSRLKMAGIGETPWDSSIHLEGKEDLGGGRYIKFNLGTTFATDSGSFANSSVMFDASRIMIGNDSVEFAFGRIGGFTFATEPYSVYTRLNANMTAMQLTGIAPANISYRPLRATNAVAVATPMGKKGAYAQALYSNGDVNAGLDEEKSYDWSDRMHVFQAAAGWVGEQLRWGAVYSREMQSNHAPQAERRHATQALHFIASYDFGGPALALVAFAGWDMWRIGGMQDLNQMLAQGSSAADLAQGSSLMNRSCRGLDAQSAILTGRYPMGPRQFSFSLGYLQGSWKGVQADVKHADGSLWQAGLAYRYYFSKKTNWYSAVSYADGNRLFGEVARFNQVMATTGLAVSF